MSLEGLLTKRCVLITGKGGTGKSHVAAAAARWASRRGRRVLVCEIGDQTADYSPFARLFGRDQLPRFPEELVPGIRGVALLASAGQELFLTSVLHTATLARAAIHSEAIRKLLDAGPSFREMGVFYHLLTLLRARHPDGTPQNELVLIDMPATGHTLSLTGLPELLLRLVPRGPIADALREGQSYLNDPARGSAYVVTLPEALPISECLELLDGLKSTAMPAGGVLVNRVPDDPFTPGERSALQPLLDRLPLLGSEGFFRHAQCSRELRRLREQTDLPVLELPDCPPGTNLVALLAEAMERGAAGAAQLAASAVVCEPEVPAHRAAVGA